MPRGTDVHVGFFCPQSKQICVTGEVSLGGGRVQKLQVLRDGYKLPGTSQGALDMTPRTLFAGFVFSFSKIFSDCCLDASPLILATEDGRRWRTRYLCLLWNSGGRDWMLGFCASRRRRGSSRASGWAAGCCEMD